jgi:hypothetical protein
MADDDHKLLDQISARSGASHASVCLPLSLGAACVSSLQPCREVLARALRRWLTRILAAARVACS